MEAWSRRAWGAAVAVACLAAALVCTWPLALHLTSAVPLGTESAATIPLFDAWTLWWSADRLGHGYVGLWNAPIFHPTAGAFTLSEPLLLPGLLAAPFFALHAPAALAHNLVLLAVLALDGLFACRWARAWGAPRLPALLAGVATVALPFLAKLQGELPILAVAGTLATLDGLARFGTGARLRHAIAAAAGFVAQALSCQQLALLSLPFLLAAALVALGEQRFARAPVVRLAGAAALGGLLVLALFHHPLHVHGELGLHRDADLVQALSATPGDFLTRPSGASLGWPAREDPTTYTGGLFPGFVLLGLACYGAARPLPDGRRGRWRGYALGACVGAFLLSLGLNVSVGGWRPFATLRVMPGFAELRSIFRAAVFAQLHLIPLAALGLAALATRVRRRANAVVLALGLAAALENLSLPARLLAVPRPIHTGWSAYLAAQPPGTVVAHVPFPADGTVEALASEAWRMLAQIDHRQPLVNGYASYFPPLHRELMFAMAAQFPQHALACALRRVFGADLLVVDEPWLASRRVAFAELAPLLEPAYADTTVSIYRLRPSEAECPPMKIELGR